MANDATRAEFWRQFIATRCEYPAPARLQAQLAVAEFFEFCACGCNSFAVRIPGSARVEPLAPPYAHRYAAFEAFFHLPADKSLEVVIHLDADGYIDYVNVDCCANSEPVPDEIEAADPPYRVWASQRLYI